MALVEWVSHHGSVLNICFEIICLLCLIGQCARSGIEYFEYPVYYKVAPYTPLQLLVPHFSICIPTPVLVDEHYEKAFFVSNEGVADGKTLEYLYSIVPQANETVVECAYRRMHTDRMFSLARNDCTDFFKIKVYRLFGYICYKYTSPPFNYSMFSVVNTFTERRVLYSTVVDEPLNQGYKLLPMLHLDDYPTDDRNWNQELLPSGTSNESYSLSQIIYEMHRLPPPYESNCGSESRFHCLTKCFQLALKAYGLQPNSNIPELDDSKLIFAFTNASYKGKSFLEIHFEIMPKCEKKCERVKKCDETIVKTVVSPPEKSKHKLKFTIDTICQPVTRSNTEAKWNMIDFIFYCTSLGSIWIGLSFLGLLDQLCSLCTRDKSGEKMMDMVKKSERSLFIKKQIECNLMQQSLSLEEPTVEKKSKPRYKPATKILIISTSLVVKLIIVIGFVYQTYCITFSFLKYSTGTQLDFDLNPSFNAPSIVVCVRLELVLDNKMPPLAEVTHENYNEIFNITDEAFSMPLGPMMNQSWDSDRVLFKCRYRRISLNESWIHQLHDQEECMKKFESEKFYYSGKMCYSFRMRDNLADDQYHHKLQASDPGIFYSIILTEQVVAGDSIAVTLFPGDRKWPVESIELSSFIHHSDNNRLLLVAPNSHRKISLPYPYEDRCNKFISKTACAQLCFREKSLAAFDRLSFTDIISEDEALNSLADKQLLLYSILNSTRTSNRLSEMEKECSRKCSHEKCDVTVFNTLVNFGFPSEYKLELAVDVHSSPDVTRRSVPHLTFADFAYQFFSTAAFWFAFTVLSANPVTFVSCLTESDTRATECLWKKFKKVKKTNAILKQFIKSLNQLFGLRLVYQSTEKTNSPRWYNYLYRFLKKDSSICYNIFKVSFALGCAFHLFTALSDYLKYPVTMNVFATVEARSAKAYDISICLSTSDTLRANSSSQFGFSRHSSDSPEMPIRDIFLNTPDAEDILVACGYRGWSQSSVRNLTDRIYFFELKDKNRCHWIYSSQKFLLQGFVCYKFRQRRVVDAAKDADTLLINNPRHILSLVINSTYITRRFLVTVSDQGRPPAYSGVWAPTITKKGDSVWMAFSYIKIVRHVLNPPFGNDGFTDSSIVGCMSDCINTFLHRFGAVDPGLISEPPANNFRYLTSRDLEDSMVRSLHLEYEEKCKNLCFSANKHDSLTINTFITLLNEWKDEPNDLAQYVNRTQIHLTTTEYPVITVKFIRSQPLTELFIILGNIFGIWFGLSAVHCDPLRYFKKYRDIPPDELAACKSELDVVSTTIHQVYYFFFAWKN